MSAYTTDDMSSSNRTGLKFIIDSHIVTDYTPTEMRLKQLHREGWIDLELTDVTRTEWQAATPEKRQRLEELGAAFSEYHGPAVLEHSIPGRSVRGSPEDQQRLERVFEILFPQYGYWEAAADDHRKQDFRDAMNIATAIRYAVDGFVTRDRDLLRKGDLIKAAFNDFRVLSPPQAISITERAIRRWQARD
jgi:predicted nucleic acid-binding protein